MSEKKSLRRFGAIAAIVAVLVSLLLITGGRYMQRRFYQTHALPNSSVFGISVENLTQEQIEKKIRSLPADRISGMTITFVPVSFEDTREHYGDFYDWEQAVSFTCEELGITLTEEYIRHIAKQGFMVGRESGTTAAYMSEIKQGGGNINPMPPLTEELLDTVLEKLEMAWTGEPVHFAYALEGERIVFTKARDGIVIDRATTEEELNREYGWGERTVIRVIRVYAQQGDLDALAQTLPGFDLDEAKRLMEETAPGESFSLPYTS